MEERPASTSTTTTGESETAQEATLPPTSVEVDQPQVEENPYNVQLTTTTTTAQPCNDLSESPSTKETSPSLQAPVKLPMAPLVDYGIEDSADESECKDEEPSMPPPATVGDHAIETNNQNETMTEEKVEEEVRPPTLPTDNPVVNETVPSPGQRPLESEMKELQLNHQQHGDGPEIEEIDIDYEEVVLPVQLEVEAQPPPQVEVSEEPEVNHPQSVASESAVLAPSTTSTTTPAEVVTTTTEQPTAMEVDEEDPLVETILFTSGQSSAETIVGDEEMVTLNKTVVQEPPQQQQPEEEQQLNVEAPDLSHDHLEKQEMIKEATAAVDSQQSTDTATILNSTDSSSKDSLPEEEIALPSPMMVEPTLTPVTSATTPVKEDEFPGSDLFKSVKFAVCEDMENVDKIKRLLVGNGAKFLNYLSDSATHLIADNGEHLSVSEAIDIYEKPVVTSQWVYLSLRSGKVLPLAPFSPFRDRLFSSVVACPSRLSPADRAAVWSMITYHGGAFQTRLDAKVTHLITGAIAGAKYETACRQLKTCRIVTPDWVVDSVRKKSTVEEERYHPKLLLTYNAGKKVESRKQAETSNKQSSSVKEADTTEDGASLQVPRATKSVTMAISTEAVLSRKVDPVKIEVETKPELPPSTAPPLVLVNVQTAAATGLPATANQTVPTHHSHSSVPNTQTGTFPPHRHPHPNQMQGGVHPQAHGAGHPHGHHPQVYNLQHGQQQQQQPHPQQSKAVQLMAHGQQAVGHFAAQQQQQQQMHPQHAMQANRHMAPNMQQGQMMPGQHPQQHPHGHPGQPGMIHPQQQQQQQQQLHLQHQQQAQQQQQMTMTGPQGKKKAGQVNAVKSKGTKGRGGPKKHQNQQQQQQQVQPGGQQQHVGGHHTPDRLLSPKLEQQPQQQGPMMHPQQQRPLTPQGGGVPMSYHPGAGMMQQQSPQPQMVSNSPMHSPTYRGQAPANVAMVQQQQQQQMGVMGQQQKQVMAPGHPQQQQAPRQVYLTLQQQQMSQQQQMQFVNGQGQFVRGQFLQTRPGMHPQQVQQAQQQQAQQQQQMGVAGHGQVIPPGMQPQQQQAMYRHQAQYPQQQQQMHPQQQQRPMQYGAQGQQVYLNQQQQQQPGAQMGVPGQMQQQRMVVMQQQQPVVSAQQQQVMMNQNAYTQMSVVHQQQEQVARSPAGMSPGAVGQQAYPQQVQQVQAGQPQQGVVGVPQQRMIRMANLTPEQQQQLIQQQKMQQQAAAQQKQSVANYQVNLQQQQQQPGGPGGQQMIRPMSHSPMSHSPMSHSPGQGSPQTPPQMLSPNGTPVPVQRMMLRPGMHPGQQVQQQQHQQQVYQQQQQQQQMVDPSKGPQQQGGPQQIAVRPPVPMTVQQQQQGGLPPQQFAANQQQIQFIRQRWPAPQQNDGRQQFVGGPRPPGPPQQQGQQPHPQYVQMNAAAPGGVPRPMVAVTDLQLPPPPPHLNPQQQQIWLQNQQAQLRHRFQLLQQQRMAQQQQQAQQQRMNGPGTMQVQQQQPPMPDGAQSSTVKVRMSTGGGGSAVHGNSQVVSTAITAVVGGGLDTVISAAAHPVAAQTGLVQQQHFVQQQQQQGHAVGSVGPNSEQQQHHPQVSKAQTGAPASSTHQAPHPTAQPQPQQQHQAPGFHPQVPVNRESGGGTSSSSASSSSASTPTSSSTGGGGGSVVNEKTKTALANLLNNRLNHQQQQAANGSGHSSPTTPTAPGGLPQISTGVLGAALAGKPKGHHHQQTQQGGRAAAAGTSMLANSGAIGATSMTQQSTVPSSVSVSSDTVSGQPQSSSSSLASHAVAASEMTSHGQVVPPVPVGQHHQHHHPHHHQQAGSMAPGQMAPVGPNGVPLVQPPPQSLQPFSGHHGQGQQGGFPAQVPPPTQQQVAPPTPMMNGPSTLAHMPPHGHQGQQLRPGGLLPGGHHFTVHQGAALNGPTLQSMNSQLGKAPPPTANGPTPSNGQPVPTPTTPTTPSATSSTAPLPTIIQIRFFGHESRQVIPPEVCIIGCVFYIAPSYTENPSTAALVPGWKRTIEKYGGRVVDRYVSGPANPVTHVLTEHMHGAVQKTALGESKRCVSVFWLDDVLCNKRLLPPWRFYHLPVAYSGKLPCVNHIIAISNFEGEEREKLISLIRRTGAKYTNYLTSKNTILICKRLEGAKYEKALQWRIAIVNLCWLQDVFFGHLEALQLSSLPKKYQQFEQYAPTGPSAPSSASLTSGGAVNGASLASTGGGANMTPSQMLQRDIFRVDYSMVHTLMGPWRVPIKYDQEELADRLAKKAVEEETRRKEDAEKARLKAEKEREEEAARVEAEKEKELTKGLSDETVPMEETAVSAEKTTMEEVTPAVDGASTAMKRSFDEMKATEETTTPSSLEVMTPKLTEEKEKRDEVAPEAEPPSAKKAKLVEAGVEVKVEDSEMAEEELKAPVSEPEITPMEVVQVVETLQEAVSEGRDSSAEVPTATTTTADASTERSSSTKEPSLADTEEAMETDATPALVAKEAEPVRLEIKEEPTEEGSLQEKADSVGPEVTPVQMANGPVEQEKSVGPSEAQTGATIEPPVAAAAAAPIPLSVAELTETSSPANEDLSASVQFKVPMANGGGPIPTTAIGRTASTTPSPTPPLPPPARTISVLFTKLDPSTRSSLHATVLQLGGTVVTDPTTCTHLIADSLQPTVNFLCAFPRAQYVLTSAWLRESARTGVFTDEADYTLSDSEGEELYGVDLQAVLSTRTPNLLENTVFMMTRSCVPSPSLLRSIITANGGVAVLYQRPSRRQLDSLVQRKLDFVVVTCETDLHTCESFFKKNIKVVSVNCILNAVLRQKLDYETYAFTAPSAPTPNTPTIKADSEGAKHGQVHPGLNHHPTATQTPQVPPPNGLRGRSLLPSNLLQESLTSTS